MNPGPWVSWKGGGTTPPPPPPPPLGRFPIAFEIISKLVLKRCGDKQAAHVTGGNTHRHTSPRPHPPIQ